MYLGLIKFPIVCCFYIIDHSYLKEDMHISRVLQELTDIVAHVEGRVCDQESNLLMFIISSSKILEVTFLCA